MQKSKIFILLIIASLSLSASFDLWPQELSYSFLLELGIAALDKEDYDEALRYFSLAQAVNPSQKEPLFYINLIKRIHEGAALEIVSPGKHIRIEAPALREDIFSLSEREFILKGEQKKQALERAYQALPQDQVVLKEDLQRRKISIQEALDEFTQERVVVAEPQAIPPAEVQGRLVYLDQALWSTQPKTVLEIEAGRDLILQGSSISRFLALTPDFLSIEKRPKGELAITAPHRGMTTLLVWDQRGRWTFNLKVLPPPRAVPLEGDKLIEEVKPFRLFTATDWNAFYRGRRIDELQRQSLSFTRWMGFYGDTPYGEFDAAMNWEKFGDTTEVTGYTLGLTDGDIGFIEDFDLRAFDIYRGFSELSYPGTYIKGGLWQQRLFDEMIEYTLLWGRERGGVFGFLAAGTVDDEEDSFLGGGKLTLFPHADNRISFNYARGYGDDRDLDLKEKVYSIDTRHVFPGGSVFTETAFDEENFAGYLTSAFSTDVVNLRLSFRDIETDFRNIVGRPPDQGQIGGTLSLDWQMMDSLAFYSNLDIYRDRFLFNEAEPKKINYDYDGALTWYIDRDSSLRASTFYAYNPGILSPRRNLNVFTTYNRNFTLFDNKRFSTYLGTGYQRSRNPLSRTSDYDNRRLFGGFRIGLTDALDYYFSYNYNWLDEKLPNAKANPAVMETGVDYYKRITDWLHTDVRFYYRDEEETSATHSFLSGEDSIEGSLRLTYTPLKDLEIFVDGRVRNIWADDPSVAKRMEADVRFGARGAWDTPFRWNPKADIFGLVFKDTNSNGIREANEEPISGVEVRVGEKRLVSDEDGTFLTTVRAKEVKVSLDPNTLPDRYVLTTPISQQVEILQGKIISVSFGATTQSGISGVVFFDANSNGRFDSGELPIGKARISLDQTTLTTTNAKGRYFFGGLPGGEYTLRIDINSIPLEYLPTIPIMNKVGLTEGTSYIFNVPLKKKQ